MVLIFMAEPGINKIHQTYHQLILEIILSNQQMNCFTLFLNQTFRGVCCVQYKPFIMKIHSSLQIVTLGAFFSKTYIKDL